MRGGVVERVTGIRSMLATAFLLRLLCNEDYIFIGPYNSHCTLATWTADSTFNLSIEILKLNPQYSVLTFDTEE